MRMSYLPLTLPPGMGQETLVLREHGGLEKCLHHTNCPPKGKEILPGKAPEQTPCLSWASQSRSLIFSLSHSFQVPFRYKTRRGVLQCLLCHAAH